MFKKSVYKMMYRPFKTTDSKGTDLGVESINMRLPILWEYSGFLGSWGVQG